MKETKSSEIAEQRPKCEGVAKESENVFMLYANEIRAQRRRAQRPKKVPDATGVFWPRTARDFMWITEQVAIGKTNEQIFELMKNPDWRTPIVRFMGNDHCDGCGQIIAIDHCDLCLQPTAWPTSGGRDAA